MFTMFAGDLDNYSLDKDPFEESVSKYLQGSGVNRIFFFYSTTRTGKNRLSKIRCNQEKENLFLKL